MKNLQDYGKKKIKISDFKIVKNINTKKIKSKKIRLTNNTIIF